MTNLQKGLLFFSSIIFFTYSCSTESVEDLTEINSLNATINTTPCAISLANITSRTTLNINCTIDLKGKTIELPFLTNFDYNGGQIINGTLVFSSGYIDGKLLNSSLKIKGTARLKYSNFVFDKLKWNIKEGKVSSVVALNNTKNLEEIINLVKFLNGKSMQIDDLDAYFEVSKVTSTTTNRNFYPSIEAINIPSDFIFRMTNNTHLRVQPNNNQKYSLLAVRDVSNVIIIGGNLYGDRDEHTYSSDGTHEWGTLINIHSARNLKVLNTKVFNGTGDGMGIHSLGFYFHDDYNPSNNITIKGCTFDSNRRNNLSITDGFNIIIEDNTFLNAGIDTKFSSGTNPKLAIDIEAHRERANDDTLILFQKAHDITIRNNVEKSSTRGGFVVAIGENVTIENNTMETSITWGYTKNTKIKGNIFNANSDFVNRSAITGGRSNNIKTTYDNEISNNHIRGYNLGIVVYNQKNKIYNNTISQCKTSIFVKQLSNSSITNNKISSTVPYSQGIFFHYTSLNNVIINGNNINTISTPFNCSLINNDPKELNHTFLVQNNTFKSDSKSLIANSNGITFKNNTLHCPKSTIGLDIKQIKKPIFISNNVITINNTKYSECIRTDSNITKNVTKIINNTCL